VPGKKRHQRRVVRCGCLPEGKTCDQAVDKAADAAAPTADWLTEHGESLKATQKKLVADTCSYVSANPLKAVAIAVVAGFLLSRIIL
jgi:ElaB/YqjD/DUF883 family membrane-anchored ribosome-binding protein